MTVTIRRFQRRKFYRNNKDAKEEMRMILNTGARTDTVQFYCKWLLK